MRRMEVPSGGALWVGERLQGEPHEGTVIHAGAQALYFTSGEDVLAIVSRHATPVPCALVTALADLGPLDGQNRALRTGDLVTIGQGQVRTPGANVRLSRYIDYRMPTLTREAAGMLSERLTRSAGPAFGEVSAAELGGELLVMLQAEPAGALASVLGKGSGLTPYGDDVVSGLLATLRATNDPCFPGLAQGVRDIARTRTTLLSATLLSRAAVGDVLPQFARVVAGMVHDSPTLGPDIAALRAIGHTSGDGMLTGLFLGLNHITMRSCS